MYLLEIGFVVVALGFVVAQTVRAVPQRYLPLLFAAGAIAILAAAALGQLRWQMAPAYLVFGISALFLIKRSYAHVAVRSLGVAAGALALAVSIGLSLGLPVLTLPAPSGPRVVGTTSLSLLDASRDNALFGAPAEKREIYVQAWYPGAVIGGEAERRALWAELYDGERDLFALFAGYLHGVKTHSYADIRVSPREARYPVILFSHAMVSFAEQSTLLMEHLASHGYVVLAVGHPYTSMRVVSSSGKPIYPALDAINERGARVASVSDEWQPAIERAASAEEHARLSLERYERADAMNDVMAVWVGDLRFVLDSLEAPADGPAALRALASRIDTERVGLLGMSFGGGAVTELCKLDRRCRAAANMDGDTFGQRQRQPLDVPYLALTKEGGEHLDYLAQGSRSDFYRVSVAGATHLDFTDDPVVLPILSWLDIVGPIGGARIVEISNAVVLRFFDGYLRGGPKPRFEGAFPELTVLVNDAAAR